MPAEEEVDIQRQGFVRTLKDLFAGAAGGVAQVLLGKIIFALPAFCLQFQSSNNLNHQILLM